MIMYIVLLLIVIFAASPFETIQAFLNLCIDGLNWIMAVLLGIFNGVAQMILVLVYGLINLIMGGITSLLALIMPAEWIQIATPTVSFSFVVEHISFAAMGLNTAFSPIGFFLSGIVTDPTMANVIGGVGLLAFAVLAIIAVLRMRK